MLKMRLFLFLPSVYPVTGMICIGCCALVFCSGSLFYPAMFSIVQFSLSLNIVDLFIILPPLKCCILSSLAQYRTAGQT